MKILNRKFEFNKNELVFIKKEISKYENKRAALIEILKFIQKRTRWISSSILKSLSKLLDIPVSDIEEISTFYSNIFRKPVGKYIIRYCDSIVCYINNYQMIKDTIECQLCIVAGQTTKDKKFTLLPTSCLGKCNLSPVIMINNITYTNLSSENIKEILEKHR